MIHIDDARRLYALHTARTTYAMAVDDEVGS